MLTVLSKENVHRILCSLTGDNVRDLQQTLADALHQYSLAGEDDGCCATNQPKQIALNRADGTTLSIIPASSNNGVGVKVVTQTKPPTSTNEAPSSTDKAPDSNTATAGIMTLLDTHGNPTAVINAEELTAFRTALASCILLQKRTRIHDVTVFGAGKQAYWHIRLALLLRGEEIHHLNVVNRSFERAKDMLVSLYHPLPDDPEFVNPLGEKLHSKTRTALLTPVHTEYQRLLKEYVRAADVIMCTTPATAPLFPASYLLNPEGRRKGRYVACIGSQRPNMTELDPDVLRAAVQQQPPPSPRRHIHRRQQREGGAVIVDSVDACLRDAGEIVQADIQPEQVVELGELMILRREAERAAKEARETAGSAGAKSAIFASDKAPSATAAVTSGVQVPNTSGLKDWLFKGNVIYKSVGIGLADVVVAAEIVRLARECGIGTHIPDF